MPTPDHKPPQVMPQSFQEAFERKTSDGLQESINLLRQELAELRMLLRPPSSIILTGPQAAEAYRKLLEG